MTGLRGRFAKGMAWASSETYGSAAITFIFTAWLARLLRPEDFGLAAAASVVTAFFFLLVDALSSTVVQHRDADRNQLSALFWLCEILLFAIYVVIFLLAPSISAAAGASELTGIFRVACLQLPVLGLLLVPLATLRSQLRFRELAFCQISAALFAGIVAAAAAMNGYGYWALIIHGLVLIGFRTALLWWLSRFRPTMGVDLRAVKPMLRYGSGLAGFTTVNYWSRNFDVVLIGRSFGAQALGFYSLAFRLIGTPIQFVNSALRPLLHPTLVAMAGDQPRIRAAYLRVVRATALITFPVAVVLWAGADQIVLLIWGRGWEPAADILRGLALLAAVQPVNSLSAAVYMERDATGLLFKLSLVTAVFVLAAMLAGLPYGPVGVAWAISLVYALIAGPLSSWIAAVRLLGATPIQLMHAVLPGLALGGALLGAALLIQIR